MRTFAYFFLFTILLIPQLAFTQGDGDAAVIQLRNPSFEDMPRNSMPPIGWSDCGWGMETPVDVQPDPVRQFQVTMQAQEGNTYLGMVVRDNDTWERVGQELNEPMSGGQCYAFRIQLARSKVYLSQSRVTNQRANYVTPTKLRIWGGYDICDRQELIGETELVSNFDWKEYRVKLRPQENYSHLVFEVFYQTPNLIPYNGNLLLDNASPLVPMKCDESIPETPTYVEPDPTDPLFVIEPEPVDKPETQLSTKAGTPAPAPPAPTYKLGSSEGRLEVNTIFQIEQVRFKSNQAVIDPSSMPALEEIAEFMRNNPGVEIEIGGHASSQAGDKYARDISLARAKSVVDYLKNEGIKEQRMEAFGYGKSRRLCMEETDDCRRLNQRVEVKIKRIEVKRID